MTSATEVLRRMLDERGVEYVVDEEYGEKYPPEQRVTWSCDIAGEDMTVTARDYCISINDDGSADYCLDLEFHEVFTPEQAIAATMGATDANPTQAESSGTCKRVFYEPTGVYVCSECGRGLSKKLDKYCYLHYCPNCGRRIEQ